MTPRKQPANTIAKLSLLTLFASCLSFTASADLASWFKTDADFITLKDAKSEAHLFVVYPQLREGNCGVAIALDRNNSFSSNYATIASELNVSVRGKDYPMTPEKITHEGIMYKFNFDELYYGTNVLINAKNGKTFGDVLSSLSRFQDAHAIVTAIDCDEFE
ncbi:hypothetical protein OE749_01200 [Aestuariibacter sp. AA17]|uniref:Uncharacterized protein n=1 Tax=Fluctibacter corallii TaxID=2984329 RepID=A0ABT3A3P7_9ALTE|nr:hypothetical protein [Aestuariibacter sp. AA17]MCV2883311.1 hypothetical protein [Aestuariibacter sp. AA17]